MVNWIKEHPFSAIGFIILAYMVFLVLLLPTVFLHLLSGYIYSKATQSESYGLLIALPIAFVGTQFGAYCSFFVSRYCL